MHLLACQGDFSVFGALSHVFFFQKKQRHLAMALLFLRLIVLVVQFLVGVIIILGAEFLAQALLHTAATHG